MKYHVFKHEFCPTKDPVDRDKKVTDESSKPNPTMAKPTLKVISADQALPVTSDVSVKIITIPSVGKHYYTDFILGTHTSKQKCMFDPGSNINCVGYDWIGYNLECGSIKTAGGNNLDVEARGFFKISWPPKNPTISADQWSYIVHGEDGIILGTPACQALGVIDDDWRISTLLQNLDHLSCVHTLDASGNNSQICNNQSTKVDPLVPNPPTSYDELLYDLNWQHTCTPQPSESSVQVSFVVANGHNIAYTEDTNFTPLLQSYKICF